MTNENISVTEVQNENSVIAERRAKLLKLREHGVAYPNDFVRKDLFGDLNEKYGNKTAEELAALAPKVACAGRVMLNIDKTFFLRRIIKLKYRPDSSG